MNTHLKNGKLSDYGFSCGYVEKEENNGKRKELYKEHGFTYHVRVFEQNVETKWHVYYRLVDARKKYNSIKL